MNQRFRYQIIKGNETLYSITLKKSAEKDLDRINEPFISKIISEIENLSINPRNEKVIKLSGKINNYRLKVGDYRALFFIDDKSKSVHIARVLHRQEAYKN